jgi:hypothetical protein
MAPPRVKGHIERGIGIARRCRDEICGLVEPTKVDAKMREPIVDPDRQQSMRPLAHRLSAQ